MADSRLNLSGVLKKSTRTPVLHAGVFPKGIRFYAGFDRYQTEVGIYVFLMRAYKTTAPQGYVYWYAVNEPDSSGSLSPYDPSDLSDVVVSGSYEV